MISDPGSVVFKLVPPKAMKEKKNKIGKKSCGVAVCQFTLNCSPWFPVFLCPFMLSIVSKMVNVSTFMSTTLNQTDPKRTFCYIGCNFACLAAPSPVTGGAPPGDV